MPQYNLGHTERVARIERLMTRHRGLHLAGSSYRGVGIPDCITSGWTAADAVISDREHGDRLVNVERGFAGRRKTGGERKIGG